MKNKFDYYQQMLAEMPVKLTCEECVELLRNKSKENKEKFMANFYRYIYSMALKIYQLYRSEFNGYYDFDDLINDSYIEISRLYDSFTCYDSDYKINFFNFTNASRQKILTQLIKTGAFKISWDTWKQFYEIRKIQREYLRENGCDISKEQLASLSGCSSHVLNKNFSFMPLTEQTIVDDCFEEKVIKAMEEDDLYDDLVKINNLSACNLQTICTVYGMVDGHVHGMTELARMNNVSRNAIYLRCQKAMETIRSNEHFVKKYTK